MQRHATLADIFSAGMQAASPFLREDTRKLKERNDLELRVFSERYAADLELEKNSFPYSGDYDGYLRMLNNFSDKKFAEAMGNQTSEYSRKQLDQMQRLSKAAIEMHADQQRAQWQYKNREAEYEKRQNINIKSQALDMRKKLQALLDELDLHADQNGWSPEARAKEKARLYRALAGGELAIDIGSFATVSQAHEKLEKIRDNLAAAVDGREGEENSLDGWVPDNRDMLEEAKGAATKAIWDKHGQMIQGAQGAFERLIVESDGGLDGAIRFGKKWQAILKRYYNPDNDEYENLSGQQKNQFGNYFNVGELEGYKKKGELGEAMALLKAYGPEMFIRPQLQGDGTVLVGHRENGMPIFAQYKSIKEAMEGFIFYEKQAFLASKGGEDAVTLQLWQKEEAEWFDKFYDKVGEALKQIKPQLKSDFDKFRKFDTFMKQGTEKNKNEYYNKDIEKLSVEERDLYAQRCVDFFESIFFNGVTDAAAIQQMMRDFTGKEIIKVLEYKGTKDSEAEQLKQLKAFSDKAMGEKAEDILFVKYAPERLAVPGGEAGPTYVWRDEAQREAVEKVLEDERRRSADILGLSIDELKPHWMPSARRKGDVIPKGIFTVDKGEQKGTYYLGYDESANQVVMKQNPETKEWKEHKKVERPLTPDESARQTRQRAQPLMEALKEGKNPLTGEELDYKRNAPPTFDRQRRAAYSNPRVSDETRLQMWADYFIELQEEQGR